MLDNYRLLEEITYIHMHHLRYYAWNKLWRKTLFDDNNIQFYDIRYYEDGPSTIKLLTHANKVVLIDKKYYYYRIVSNSITHVPQTASHRNDYLKSRIEMFNILKTSQYDDIKIKSLNNTLASIIKMYYYLVFVDNKNNYEQCSRDYFHTYQDLIETNKELYKNISIKYRFFYFLFNFFPKTISLILYIPLKTPKQYKKQIDKSKKCVNI